MPVAKLQTAATVVTNSTRREHCGTGAQHLAAERLLNAKANGTAEKTVKRLEEGTNIDESHKCSISKKESC